MIIFGNKSFKILLSFRMGNRCCSNAPDQVITDGGDLPPVMIDSISDPIKKFEHRFPLHRMDVQKMFDRIHAF